MKQLIKQMIANYNAIKFATHKELKVTSAPSYMNPAYRPAQQYNKRMK